MERLRKKDLHIASGGIVDYRQQHVHISLSLLPNVVIDREREYNVSKNLIEWPCLCAPTMRNVADNSRILFARDV